MSGIHYEQRHGIATATIVRPTSRNALGPEEWQGLAGIVQRVAAEPAVRVLVIAGAGGVFSAGGDLQTMPERLALPKETRRANLLADAQVITALQQLPKPVLAMIDGAAVGAGLSLALACDLRFASDRARFGAPFHKLGLTGDFGLLWNLPRVVGLAAAMDLLMSSEIIDVQRALGIGLVTRVFPCERLTEETYAYATVLAQGPPIALAMTKRGLYAGLTCELAAMLEWEAEAQATCSKTEDAREGVAAFLEKRAALFIGR